jgi:hypothetical protein
MNNFLNKIFGVFPRQPDKEGDKEISGPIIRMDENRFLKPLIAILCIWAMMNNQVNHGYSARILT